MQHYTKRMQHYKKHLQHYTRPRPPSASASAEYTKPGSGISATRPVPVPDDAYPYQYLTWTKNRYPTRPDVPTRGYTRTRGLPVGKLLVSYPYIPRCSISLMEQRLLVGTE